MSVRKAFIGLIFVAVLVGVATFFNQPKQRPFPFSSPLELLPDYQRPGEGVTLYPTGGPYGIDVIEAIALGRGETVFVGTFGGGIFKTEDDGAHWTPSNRGLQDKFISTLIILENETVFAATIRAGLFKSEDNGEHWVSTNVGLEKTDVKSMAVLSTGELLAGTGKGVYISHDEGGVWEPFNNNLDRVEIQSIVVTKDQTIFAATQGSGLYKREPGEEKWIQVVKGFLSPSLGLEERTIRALVLGRGEALFAGTMGAGIYRSLDGGLHWGSANTGLGNFSIRTLAVDDQGRLYAGTGEGVFYSEDNGLQWFPLLEGMSNVQVHSFGVGKGGRLYAGTSGGVFLGKIGVVWESFHEQLLVSPVHALDYAAGVITVGTAGKGTYINRHDNWMSDNLGLVNLSIRGLAHGKAYLYAITGDGVYRRQLGRHQWQWLQEVPGGEVHAIGVDLMDHVYIGSEDGIFSSSDHGESWVREEDIGSTPVTALDVSGNTFFAATENAIWAQLPGAGWKSVITKEGSAFQVILWRAGKGLLAVTDNKIWERDLQGVWRELAGGGPEGVQIASIAVDPHNNDMLYAGTDRGLFWSIDNGTTWEQAQLYQGNPFEGKVSQVLPTDSIALWLATESDGVVLGIAKPARRNILERWLDAFSEGDFSFSQLLKKDSKIAGQG